MVRKCLYWAAILLVLLLSLAAGAAKVTLAPSEVEFFGRRGLTETQIVVFGVVQILSAVLMLFQICRRVGAALVSATFAVSLFFLAQDGWGAVAYVTILMTALGLMVALLSRETWLGRAGS